MSTIGLTIYALMWPVIVAVVMVIIARGFIGEWLEARRKGEDIV